MVVAIELFDSRKHTTGSSPSVILKYRIKGSDDDVAILAALADEAPDFYSQVVGGISLGLIRKSRTIERYSDEEWTGTVRYGLRDAGSTDTGDQSTFRFSTGGGSNHITNSILNLGNFTSTGDDGPDFDGAIGVTESGVEGVDVVSPQYQFTETHSIGDDIVTEDYKKDLAALTGTVNNADFRSFEAGEVLFLGADGEDRGDNVWEITFSYAVQNNETNLAIGSNITIPSKEGWDYVWVRYGEQKDVASNVTVQVPLSAHVERVYPRKSFGILPPS